MADKPHQFQMTYRSEQDRLLLRISTRDNSEFRLWLTRHMVRSLGDALLKMTEAGPAKAAAEETGKREAIRHFEHQSAVEQADFETAFEETADSFPLGEEGILVTSIQVGVTPAGTYTLKLGPAQGKGISINLDDILLHSFMKMLIDSSNHAHWDLELSLPVSGSTTSADTSPPKKTMRH